MWADLNVRPISADLLYVAALALALGGLCLSAGVG